MKDKRERDFPFSQDYIESAMLAGQVKLLTDREHRMNEKYIEIIQEKAQIKMAFELQQKEIELLKKKLGDFEN